MDLWNFLAKKKNTLMGHPDALKYQIPRRDYQLPHFTDFCDPRFAFAHGAQQGGAGIQKIGFLMYYQWLHCVGNWGEEHSMCKKARWYLEKMMHEPVLERMDEKKKLGHYDYTILYGAKPWKGFNPVYQPVKTVRPGAYEFWQSRDFKALYTLDAADWKTKAPILHEMFVLGKKPCAEDE